MTVSLLEQWSVVYLDEWNCYTAPERRPRGLRGIVHGHPRHEDGTRITTSRIGSANGRRVTTESGSVYHLGDAEEAFLLVCAERGIVVDSENPVKIR